jgi:hypothetical protein
MDVWRCMRGLGNFVANLNRHNSSNQSERPLFSQLVCDGHGNSVRAAALDHTPLNTTAPRLEQEFRYDVQTQPHNSREVTDDFGVSKGLEIIPARNFEVILAVSPFVVNNPDSRDGFGDWQVPVKCRITAQNEEHGNYSLTAFSQISAPTGHFQQGAFSPVITPTRSPTERAGVISMFREHRESRCPL